jgi:acyl-CoA-binding protein
MTEVGMTRGLKMYSWSAQAMHGDNETPQPWSINLVASMKWKAWKNIQGMDRVKAAN